MKNFYLSVVIPAYNEEKRISTILQAILDFEKTKTFQIQTIVVVDASPDRTAEVAKSFIGKISNLTVIEGKVNKGKGGAVQEGMLTAQGEYILFADADNSTPIEQVDKLLKYSEKNEVVIGSRYCKGGKLAIPQPITRRFGSRVLNLIIQALAIPGIRDTQCGFKMFSNRAAKEIFQHQTIFDFSFDIEILAIAKKLGYKIKETGITWYDNPHSTVNPLKDGVRMIKDAWRVRKNLLDNVYQLVKR
jgi:dolichyl-phosphate beta-glucosyltransferase